MKLSTYLNNIIYLNNDEVKIGVLPTVGGRLVYLSYFDSDNLLKADKNQWNESKEERIEPSPFSKFKAYNGFITWIGPQSKWWENQNINTELRDIKSVWPPDPYLIYGKYDIAKRTDTSLILIGRKSPVSGVKLTKHFTLSKNKLKIKVSAQNVKGKEISFDLWSNARFNQATKFIIPAYEEDLLRVESKKTELVDNLDYSIENGYFTFRQNTPLNGENDRVAKAFLHPKKGNIIAIKNNIFLLMEFDEVSPTQIHPDHAFIEVYNKISSKENDYLLELEHHSSYKTIKPGESHSMSETWSLFKYKYQLKDYRDYYRFYKDIESK